MGYALGCGEPSLDAILAAPLLAIPSCSDGARNALETDVDCGGGACSTCDTGRSCLLDSDCATACVEGRCWSGRHCADIHAQRPSAPSGTFLIDPVRAGSSQPFAVYCNMAMAGGGWTRVAFEPAGVGREFEESALTYLGRNDVAAPQAVAEPSGAGLIGARLAGTYREVTVTWGSEFVRFTPTKELFANEVDLQIPLLNFATNNALLNEWVLMAGGASFCRSSRFPDVRPGDTSWAVKPVNSLGTGCGCNEQVWLDRGAFYGGGVPRTSCSSDRGGAWSGVKDIREQKAGLTSTAALSIWVR